jgi:hypothetical protein
MPGNRRASPTSGDDRFGKGINREAICTAGRHAGGFTAWRADNRWMRGHTVRGGEASAFFWLGSGERDIEIIYWSAVASPIDALEHDQTMARKGFFCGAASLSAQQTAIVLNIRRA